MTDLKKLLIAGILLLAFALRFYGVNWDQNQHLHPDERFLTMVTEAIDWPADIPEYFDTAHSPLNPHNRGFGFFVYGTFPMFFTKIIAESLRKANYQDITLIGRQLSALFDLGTVFLVLAIGKELVLKSKKKLSETIPILAMLLYALSVLPIQLAHFYGMESYLTFFITLSFLLIVKLLNKISFGNSASSAYLLTALLGISFGLSVASKISAVIFLPVVALGFFFVFIKGRKILLPAALAVIFFTLAYLTIRLAQPYLFSNSKLISFSLNPKVLDNWKQLQNTMKPDSGFPPSVQWFNITPLIFPLKSLIVWGLGLPLGIIALLGVIRTFLATIKDLFYLKKIKFSKFLDSLDKIFHPILVFRLLLLSWILGLFLYQGIQPAPTIRYFYPLYPFLAIVSAFFLTEIKPGIPRFLYLSVIFSFFLWPLSFMAIYKKPHSRTQASLWIYKNIPPKAIIGVEHWDDGLPMTLDSERLNIFYTYLSLPLYDPDTRDKWLKMSTVLAQTDYLVLSSNRLWGSITRVPAIYPVTSKYYRLLFAGKLGFKKVAEFTSYPDLPLPSGNTCLYLFPSQEKFLGLTTENNRFIRLNRCDLYPENYYQGIVVRDDWAEETFTVYDHPKVIIFKKEKALNYFDLLYR